MMSMTTLHIVFWRMEEECVYGCHFGVKIKFSFNLSFPIRKFLENPSTTCSLVSAHVAMEDNSASKGQDLEELLLHVMAIMVIIMTVI